MEYSFYVPIIHKGHHSDRKKLKFYVASLTPTSFGSKTRNRNLPSSSWSSETLKDMIISRMRDWSSDNEDMAAAAMGFYDGDCFVFEVADV